MEWCKACGDAPADERTLPFCAACEDNLCHLYALVFDRHGLGFCGCGNPDAAYGLAREILSLMSLFENGGRAKARELCGTEGAYYMVLYALDRAELTEHGSSADGSWLTARGRHYLALMTRYADLDLLDEAGYPHGGDGCPADCPHEVASA